MTRRPRLLMIGRTRYRLPLNDSLRAKFDALRERFDVRVLASGVDGSPRRDDVFELAGPWRPRWLDGALYFLSLPFRTRRELRSTPPDGVLVQGAHETWFVLLGRSLSGVRAPVILDVHGDWRSPTRLYGSPARRLLNPLADRVALSALHRADAVRTISDYTTGLVRSHGVEPAAVFPAFMDLEPFLGPAVPLPTRPRALFVGVLEHYKGIDELADAWRTVAARLPDATLHLVGRGTRREVVERLVADLPDRAEWTEALADRGRRAGARRGDGARPAVALGGDGPRPGRGVLPRAGGGGVAGRRHRRPRPRRRERAARPAAATRRRSRTRSTACSPTATWPSGSGRARRRVQRRGRRPRRSTRRGWRRWSRDYDRRVRADRIKQALKNGVYRALGETAAGVGASDGGEQRTLRVLMYHKVNDVPRTPSPSRSACSTSRWRSSATSATSLSRSTPCSTTTCSGRRSRRARS